ncbi:DUF4177 domain-containing protein [Alteromonas sediminis]|uniref:DUF4177 domain-containing protein n=1 Tax=Alteromonas sediminis TaxID=2259342 RepID=A0A3N5YAZ0_9ALTE|nr:DUF4177 domain-containing protein [Alteromonas sediminis]
MKRYEYKVVNAGNLFGPRVHNIEKCQDLCERNGKIGWELVSTKYHWLSTQYTLFFKRTIEEE